MYKKGIVFALCLLCISQSVPLNVFAEGTTYNIGAEEESIFDSDIIQASGVVAVRQKTAADIAAQRKFTAWQGHGFAAEQGNNLVDKIKGKNTSVVGDNNAKNGPDRLIKNLDGSKIWIQDKYYNNANASINACFDTETELFRYIDGDGKPMQIEVPKDQYEAAVEHMRKKISEGKVPGVTDPQNAETLVRKGHLTYKQARNLAKAGTVESLTYDVINGVINAAPAFGISAAITYAICRRNGDSKSDALKCAVNEGLKTGGIVIGVSVVSGQMTKAGVTIFKTSPNIAIAGVTLMVLSVDDAVELFKGRISKSQFMQNFIIAAAAVGLGTAGTFGGSALGNLIVPGAGSFVGGFFGGTAGSLAAGWGASKLVGHFFKSDAEKMYGILQDTFAQLCEDYMVNEDEAQNIVYILNEKLSEKMLKDMYESKDREKFAEELLEPMFESEVRAREKIYLPNAEEMRVILLESSKEAVLIH